MGVRRALIYRAGSVGMICAAVEVAIEPGGQDREGSLRPIRDCTKPATVTVNETRFCADCGDTIARSPKQSVVRAQRPSSN
jgi:hypothetical protein